MRLTLDPEPRQPLFDLITALDFGSGGAVRVCSPLPLFEPFIGAG